MLSISTNNTLIASNMLNLSHNWRSLVFVCMGHADQGSVGPGLGSVGQATTQRIFMGIIRKECDVKMLIILVTVRSMLYRGAKCLWKHAESKPLSRLHISLLYPTFLI